ncbi:expressed protein [Echinococcus multilocularis]|uniref:Expressed protein n=1 Tax=Echinococcus multilocularis TaxID=6211 RepID=A0A068Y8D1_ECHMU|nr:expressed protein [Echinococcus multilocularis]
MPALRIKKAPQGIMCDASIGGLGCGSGGDGDTDSLRGIKTIGQVDLSISFSCTEESMGRRGGGKEDVNTDTQIWDVEKGQEITSSDAGCLVHRKFG